MSIVHPEKESSFSNTATHVVAPTKYSMLRSLISPKYVFSVIKVAKSIPC